LVLTSQNPFDRMAYYHNNGDGTFSDRSNASGLASQLGGLYCVQVDYDNDGKMDIFVPRGAWWGADGVVRPSLLHNQGDGTFKDVTHDAGLDSNPGPTQAAAWGDYDNDGYIDLYLGHEMLGQKTMPGALYRNQHDGTFK